MYDTLKRKASRWQTLPRDPAEADDCELDSERYSLLLFLQNLHYDEDRYRALIHALENAARGDRPDGANAALLDALKNLDFINFDYMLPEGPPPAKKRRLDLYGNADAFAQIMEHDELIELARKVWTDPDNIVDIPLGDLYQHNLRPLAEGDKFPLDDLFNFSRNFGEVRYRFLNHALRDDPTRWPIYESGHPLNKGNNANAMIHESNLLEDAKLVEFRSVGNRGFSDQDRALFTELYKLTPEEGRQLLKYSGPYSGLRIGLPPIFAYSVFIINTLLDWRIRVLEDARRFVLSTPAYKSAGSRRDKDRVRAQEYTNNGIDTAVAAVDALVDLFLDALRKAMSEAERENAIHQDTFELLRKTVQDVVIAVNSSPLTNHSNRQGHGVRRLLKSLAGRTLRRPTGTSLIRRCRRSP
ncbi:hypothetical protein F4777DRAFT_9064 [Nemania sp. FL0916]|nr:hypothetical protein F4777DRAFT_9064 [Nemania sp. FL0916]